MPNVTKTKIANTLIAIGIVLTGAWIAGEWLNDPNPEWTKTARSLVLLCVLLSIAFSRKRANDRPR